MSLALPGVEAAGMSVESLDQARERLRRYVEAAGGFSGWTVNVRAKVLGADPPWDYMDRAVELVSSANSILDLGTGGGERFGELLRGYEGRAVATEEWAVNAPIAAGHLSPHGAEVVRCSSLALPFADSSFDLVLARHEELDPAEVARVLFPHGTALTQQVWNIHHELARFIPRRTDFGDHFRRFQEGFHAAGLDVLDAREHFAAVAYESLGEYVYMLCIAPWEVPDFDPLGRDLEALLDLERELTTTDGLVLTEGSYIIEARRPGQ